MSRLTALRLMGVDLYVPRRPLPQARSSRQPLRPRVAAPAAAIAQRGAAVPPPLSAATAVRPPPHLPESLWHEPAVAPDRQPPVSQAAAPVTSPSTLAKQRSRAVSFNLLAVAYPETILFLSDLKSQPLPAALSASVAQFLLEVARVFDAGVGQRPRAPEYFQWPLTHGSAADTGAERAGLVLHGFVARYLREYRPPRVLLMGQLAASYLHEPMKLPDGSEPVILRGPALGRIFGDPARKAALWQVLEPHSRFGGSYP